LLVNLFNVDTGEKEQTFESKGKFIMSVAVSPNGFHLACGSETGDVYMFDVSTGRLVATIAGIYRIAFLITGHTMAVRSIAFSPDSQTLLTGSDDKRINLYDVYVMTQFSDA
jgi:WD repeat-containing protein 61